MQSSGRGVWVIAALVALAVAIVAIRHRQGEPYEIIDRIVTTDGLHQYVTVSAPEVYSELSAVETASQVVADLAADGWPVSPNGLPQSIGIRLRMLNSGTWRGSFRYDPLESIRRRQIAEAKPAEPSKPQASKQPAPTVKPKPKPQPSKQEMERRRAERLRKQYLADIAAIKARCQRQMGTHGASMVKYCADQDMAAYSALASYPRKHQRIIDRCRRTMLATGGWSVVQYCADEDIAAAKALERY